jgi:penicillin-binding protein 1C
MMAAMRGVARPGPLYTAKLERARICPLSGALAGPACPGHMDEAFLPGTAPRDACPMHVAPGVLDPGPEFYAWAEATGLRHAPGASAHAGAREARLLMPLDGDLYLHDPTLPDGAQSIPLRVVPPAGGERVAVVLDGRETLTLEAPYAARLPVVRGTHTLQIAGTDARATFTVR